MQKLLTYAETKAIFGWKSTSTVRRYVKSGDLVRVHIGHGANTFRITETSAQAFLERVKNQTDDKDYLERAAAHTAKMRRAAPPVERVKEVLLDVEEIIKNSHRCAPEPQPKPTLDDVLDDQCNAAAPPVSFAELVRARNRWIEGGCVGADPVLGAPRASAGSRFRSVRGV